MTRYLVLMHRDATADERADDWGPYLGRLQREGRLAGGSSLARSSTIRQDGLEPAEPAQPVGYLLLDADDLDHLHSLLAGNPTLAAGGTVEVCELIED